MGGLRSSARIVGTKEEGRLRPSVGMQDDENTIRQPAMHQLGDSLDALSIDELDERVMILRTEIERLEAAKSLKQTALARADSIFK